MFITVLPKPDETYICAPKVSHLHKDVHCIDADKFSSSFKFVSHQKKELLTDVKKMFIDANHCYMVPVPHSFSISCEISVFSSDNLNNCKIDEKSVFSPQTASISTMDVIKRVVQLLSGGQT